jgi:hypothetical protein
LHQSTILFHFYFLLFFWLHDSVFVSDNVSFFDDGCGDENDNSYVTMALHVE